MQPACNSIDTFHLVYADHSFSYPSRCVLQQCNLPFQNNIGKTVQNKFKNLNSNQTVGSFILLVLNGVLPHPCTYLSVLNTFGVLFKGPILQPVLWSHTGYTSRFQEKKLKDATLTFLTLDFPLKLEFKSPRMYFIIVWFNQEACQWVLPHS